MDTQSEIGRVYIVDAVTYRLVKSLSFQQCQWLGEHVLNGVDLAVLDPTILHDVMRTKGPLAMAICLVADGMTLKQHNQLAWLDILKRSADFNAEFSPQEVMAFTVPFFLLLTPASVAVMMPGKDLRKVWDEQNAQPPAPSASTSSTASWPSPEVISPSSPSSLPSGDPLIHIRTSGAALNESPSTTPSLVSAGSSYPG